MADLDLESSLLQERERADTGSDDQSQEGWTGQGASLHSSSWLPGRVAWKMSRRRSTSAIKEAF